MKEKHTKRRLVRHCQFIYNQQRDVNDNRIQKGLVSDLIGTDTYFMSKTYSTSKFETSYKEKYSPNKSSHRWSYRKYNTREGSKKEFDIILKEHGIR